MNSRLFNSKTDIQPTRAAFTLVEIVVVVAILSFVILGFTKFSVEASKSFSETAAVNLQNSDARIFTQQITADALSANLAFLYPSFELEDRDQVDDRIGRSNTGNCLAFISHTPSTDINGDRFINRVVVYYLDQQSIFRTELNIATPEDFPTTIGFESLLTSNNNNFTEGREVFQTSSATLFQCINPALGTYILIGDILNSENDINISTRG